MGVQTGFETTTTSFTGVEAVQEKKVNRLLFIIPAFLDQFEMCLKLVATIMISSSVVQMLSSSHLIYTTLLAIFFLRKKFYRHHLFSVLAIVVGIALVGLSYL